MLKLDYIRVYIKDLTLLFPVPLLGALVNLKFLLFVYCFLSFRSEILRLDYLTVFVFYIKELPLLFLNPVLRRTH